MYSIEYTGRFKKDYKLAVKRGYKETLIQNVISLIANGIGIQQQFHDLRSYYLDNRFPVGSKSQGCQYMLFFQ